MGSIKSLGIQGRQVLSELWLWRGKWVGSLGKQSTFSASPRSTSLLVLLVTFSLLASSFLFLFHIFHFFPEIVPTRHCVALPKPLSFLRMEPQVYQNQLCGCGYPSVSSSRAYIVSLDFQLKVNLNGPYQTTLTVISSSPIYP